MRRSELELSINWVRRLLPDDDQLVVIGSQSILGAFNEALLPDDARLSMEVDVLPLRDPDERKADLRWGHERPSNSRRPPSPTSRPSTTPTEADPYDR